MYNFICNRDVLHALQNKVSTLSLRIINLMHCLIKQLQFVPQSIQTSDITQMITG